MTATTPADIPTPPSDGAPKVHPARRPGYLERTNWPATILLLLGTLTVLVPLYFAIIMALKSDAQSASGSGFELPAPFVWDNFSRAWTMTHFPRAFGISLFISVVAVAGEVLLASLASYAIARNWDKRLFRWSYYYLLAAMFIPFPVIALPQVQLTAHLSLSNPIGVAILHVLMSMAFNVLLYTAFLRSIPEELEEAARIDGASTWQTFWRLIFPLLGPMNATVAIFAFLGSWNDFMMPSLITADPTLQTIPVVQKIFQLAFASNYNVAFASYLMGMAPTLLVYVVAQRWVLAGVTRGAVK